MNSGVNPSFCARSTFASAAMSACATSVCPCTSPGTAACRRPPPGRRSGAHARAPPAASRPPPPCTAAWPMLLRLVDGRARGDQRLQDLVVTAHRRVEQRAATLTSTTRRASSSIAVCRPPARPAVSGLRRCSARTRSASGSPHTAASTSQLLACRPRAPQHRARHALVDGLDAFAVPLRPSRDRSQRAPRLRCSASIMNGSSPAWRWRPRCRTSRRRPRARLASADDDREPRPARVQLDDAPQAEPKSTLRRRRRHSRETPARWRGSDTNRSAASKTGAATMSAVQPR